MARKVFLSSLGTGKYEPVEYEYHGQKATKTPYIQAALMEIYNCQDPWTDQDVVLILTTPSAKEKHWDDPDAQDDNKLKQCLEELKLAAPYQTIDIEEGITEEKELWRNFLKIYDQLENEDEIYLDITHALRYLPFFFFLLIQYAKVIKGVTIHSVHYGYFDFKESETKTLFPVIDLTSIVRLFEWTEAVSAYKYHGDARSLSQITEREYNQNRPSGQIPSACVQKLKELSGDLKVVSDYTLLCRGKEIFEGKKHSSLKEKLKNWNEEESTDYPSITALKPLIDLIEKDFVSYEEGEVSNLYHAASWCCEHNLYQQAYTLLQEAVVSYFLMRCGEQSPRIDDRNLRQNISSLLQGYQGGQDDSAMIYGDFVEGLSETDKCFFGDICSKWTFQNLSTSRNTLNHAAFNQAPVGTKKLKEEIHKYIKEFSFIQDTSMREGVDEEESNLTERKLFINYSNHQSDSWGEDQIRAAESYGTIADRPFPNVQPMLMGDAFRDLVDSEISQLNRLICEHHLRPTDVTIHIMGEMRFCYAVVSRLENLGIQAVCSTSERIFEDKGGGVSERHFRFVGFQPYY